MKKVVLGTLIAMSSISSAFAVTAQSGIYVGGFGGWSAAESPNTTQTNAQSERNKNITWGGTLGYNYAITQNWSAGVEASYLNFGETSYNNVRGPSNGLLPPNYVTGNSDIKSTGLQIMATGSYLMSNGFNVFAKAGAIDEETKTGNVAGVATSPLPNGNTSVTSWLPAAAVGLGYMPVQNFNVALQYEHTFGADWNSTGGWNNHNINKPMSQNAVTLGLTYTFPLSI